MATLVLATILLHLLAWGGFVAVHVARFAHAVFSAVSGFFADLLSPVPSFVGALVMTVFDAAFGSWPGSAPSVSCRT